MTDMHLPDAFCRLAAAGESCFASDGGEATVDRIDAAHAVSGIGGRQEKRHSAISSGTPSLPAGAIARSFARSTGTDNSSAVMRVSMVPGTMAFTRMRSRA